MEVLPSASTPEKLPAARASAPTPRDTKNNNPTPSAHRQLPRLADEEEDGQRERPRPG